MLYYQISSFINAITSIAVAIIVLAKDSKSEVNRSFSYFAFSVAVWAASYFCWVVFPDNYDEALFCAKILMIAPVFIPPTFFHFSVDFINQKAKHKYLLFAGYLSSVLFLILNMTSSLMVQSVKQKLLFPYYPVPGPFYIIHLAIFIGLVVYAHVLILLEYKRLSPLQRNQTKYVFLGTAIGFIGGASNYLLVYDVPVQPFGNILVSLYVLSIAYAILQYHLFDFTFVMRKGIIYVILIGFVSVVYLGMMVLLQPIIARWGGQESLISGLVAAVLLGIFFAPMRMKVETLVDATIFRRYTEELARQKEIMQEELMRSEKFKMVSSITRGIVYEIRNPLTTIKTHGLLIPKRLEDKDYLLKTSGTIDRQVEKINALLQQLLNFSNPSPPELQQIMIQDVIQDVINILEGEFVENKITLKTEFTVKETLSLRLDPVQIRQALYNIIANAVEAMAEGGTLTVRTALKQGRSVGQEVFDAHAEQYYEISVIDTGQGIPAENLKNIFDPFFSPEQKKTGLGLSVTHRIVREHGGFIFVNSQPGKGSTFTIELPVVRKN